MAATIKDIRNETGLSLATISKYLNGGNVLPENKVKIDRAVDKLHYQVNEMARGLVTNRTYTIGVVAQRISSVFNGTLMETIGRELRRESYGMLICDSSDDTATEAENIQFLLNKKVDGIILIATAMDASTIQPVLDAKIPLVLVDRWIPGSEVASVMLDNRKAAKTAVEYLIRNGHRKIAIIGSKEEVTGIEREEGYCEALAEAGIPIEAAYMCRGKHTLEHGYNSMKKLLRMEDAPTAVFLTNYDINLGSIIALNELSVPCPDEISLVGFDDLLLPRIVKPSLAVMRQPMQEIGAAAVRLLLAHINGEEIENDRIVFEAELLEGHSVKKIR